MHRYHHLLLKQLKRLGIDHSSHPPEAASWSRLVESVSQTYAHADAELAQLKHAQELSSTEVQGLHNQIDEAQRIAGLGNWSFDKSMRNGEWSQECYRIFGLSPSDPIPSYKDWSKRIHQDDRVHVKDRADAAMHDGKNFEIEFRYILAGGEMRWVRANGQPIKDPQGTVCRLLGTVMNVTTRKKIELRQSMEHAVGRLLAESDSAADVMPEIIQTICETLGWVCGALWTLDKQAGALQRSASWCVHDARIEHFFRGTRDAITVPKWAELHGNGLQAAKPVWIADVSLDERFQRAPQAHECGIRASLVFPIQAAGELLGIMEFFSRQAQQADQEMLQSAHFIGRHIGQFFQRNQAEAALRESEAHFRALVEQATDSFYVHDIHGKFIDVNQRGCEGLGYTRQELLDMSVHDVDVDLSAQELKKLLGRVATSTPIARESRYRRKNGSSFPVEIRTGPIEINGHQHLLSLVRDVTERKQLQDHIQHLAYHDSLTNLPNRAMFNQHLSHAITKAKRQDRSLAVLFIDLDRFKNINDTLGHNAGDSLLQEMSRRLIASLRGGDLVAHLGGGRDLVARLGGDEFVILLENVTGSAAVGQVAEKILAAMVEEHSLNGQLVHITASIGVSIFPEDGKDEFTLMKHADIAMYRAKEKGKNNFQFYSAQMSLHSAKLLALESDLRRALERDELVLHYQGKVETRTGRITGAEALVRWQHPELGLLLPEDFIPLAEETGLIIALSRWVLREACARNCAWQKEGLPPLTMAVNLSARQFIDDQLLVDTANSLKQTAMDPALLELEITESMMMNNPDKTIQILAGLKSMGIRIAIDDFGIGYSSLSHLKKFLIDIIKIDKSFIQDVPGDPANEAITEAIIAMGKSLRVTVVAEGVETIEQLKFLTERSCEEIQGYFFSKPSNAKDFADLLRRNLNTQQSKRKMSALS